MTEVTEAATEAIVEDTTQREAKEEETAMTEDAEDTAQKHTLRKEEETGDMTQMAGGCMMKRSSSSTSTK